MQTFSRVRRLEEQELRSPLIPAGTPFQTVEGASEPQPSCGQGERPGGNLNILPSDSWQNRSFEDKTLTDLELIRGEC